jgi:hypothetical protein
VISGLDGVTVDVDGVDVGATVDDLALRVVLAQLVQVFRLQLESI